MKKIISSIIVTLIITVYATTYSYAQSERSNPNNAPLITISSNWPFNCSSLSLTVFYEPTYNSSTNITRVYVQDACNQIIYLDAIGNLSSQLTTGTVINIRVNNGAVIVAVAVVAN